MKKTQDYRIGTGASAMLLVFVILSIVTLGILSLMSARSDQSLTARNIDMTTRYYRASLQAQTRIKEIDDALAVMFDEESMAEYAYREGITYSGDSFTFYEDAGEDRILNVTIQIRDGTTKGTIKRYSLENTEIWADDMFMVPFGELEDGK